MTHEGKVIIGELAEEYGYIDAGECLTVGDPNEIWHFEIMPPGPLGKGAIWAAVRIPEGHVGVSANRSRIGKIDPNDPENYMFSENVFSVAEQNGWWDPKSGEEMMALLDIPNERNIAIPRCSYHTILQARGWLPNSVGTVCWFGLNNPDTSIYVPISAGVTSLPADYAINDRTKFEFDNRESAWWAFNLVDNIVNRRYQDAIKDLRAVRDPLEEEQFAMQPAIEKVATELHSKDPDLAAKFLTNYTASRCRKAVETFWKLAETLIVKYDEKTF